MSSKSKKGRRIVNRFKGNSKPKPKPVNLIERAAKAGLTNEQIASILGITRDAFQKWLRSDQRVARAHQRGRQEPNLKVENSLFRRALGYNVVELEEKVVTNGGGKVLRKIPVMRRHKHVPASVKAIEIWLYNRDPDRWKRQAYLNVRNMSLKDKTELAHSGLFSEVEED